MRDLKKSANINPVEKVVYVEWRAMADAEPRKLRIEAIRSDGSYTTLVQEEVTVRVERDGNSEQISIWAPARGMPWTNRGSADDAIEQLLSLLDD